MWVFTRHGFYSIVAARGQPGKLLVRARVSGDLRALFGGIPNANPIDARPTVDADYRYRTVQWSVVVVAALVRAVDDIDYGNFKNACPKKRQPFYNRCWTILVAMQEAYLPRRRASRAPDDPFDWQARVAEEERES